MNIFSYKTGEGSPVITLHGLYGSYENLGMLIRKLHTCFQVHAVDLRNHGRSPHSDTMNYKCMAKDIIKYMDANNLLTVDFIGHSMGGKVAMEIALNFPERVNKLVILDIAPVTYTHNAHVVLDSMLDVDLTTVNSRQDAELQLANNISQKSIRQFLLKNLYRDPSTSKFKWRLNLEAIYKNFSNILAKPSGDYVFNNKALFLRGEKSNYVTEEHYQLIKKLFNNSVIQTIAEAGHWLHAEKPSMVSGSILKFLQE
jgi:esterase